MKYSLINIVRLSCQFDTLFNKRKFKTNDCNKAKENEIEIEHLQTRVRFV